MYARIKDAVRALGVAWFAFFAGTVYGSIAASAALWASGQCAP